MEMSLLRLFSQGLLALSMLLLASCSAKHYSLESGDKLVFYFQSAGAAEVIFATSLDKYQHHLATPLQDGLWEVTVPLQDEFTYFYLVDGRITLPACRLSEEDDFGSKNCLYLSGM